MDNINKKSARYCYDHHYDALPYGDGALVKHVPVAGIEAMKVRRAQMRTTGSIQTLNEAMCEQSEVMKNSPIYVTKIKDIPCGLDLSSLQWDLGQALTRQQSLESLCASDRSEHDNKLTSTLSPAVSKESLPRTNSFNADVAKRTLLYDSLWSDARIPRANLIQNACYSGPFLVPKPTLDHDHFVSIYLARERDSWHGLRELEQKVGKLMSNQDEVELVVLVAKVLIEQGMNDFSRALQTVNQALERYPHDEFCLYSKAELLLERPVCALTSLWQDQKRADLHMAEEVLRNMLSPNPENMQKNLWMPDLHANKHYLVWAKYYFIAARYVQAEQRETYLKTAQCMLDQIDRQSVHQEAARRLVSTLSSVEKYDQSCHVCTIS